MAVLYRKYRPQTFAEVLGQKPIIRTLKNQVASGQVAHAYLFTGSRGIGKTSIARILAKAVNCLKVKDGEPCNKCENCKAITAGNFLDLVEIDAASNTGVDNIRDLIDHVKFAPSIGKYKVFIIDEAHMLSKGAFNALLKTLEEPPSHAIFVLATTEVNKVPATIVSRTQRFDFKRFGSEEIAGLLEHVLKAEKIKLSKDVVKLVAENAEGGGRDALSLLDKVLTLGEDATVEDCEQLLGITDFSVCYKLLDLIAHGAMADAPKFFEGLMEKGTDFAIFNRDFLEFLRKVLIYQVTGGQLAEISKEHEEQIKALAVVFGAQDLIFITRLFLRSYKDLSVSPRAEIPLLLAALEAAQRKSANQQSGKAAAHPVEVKQPTLTVNHQAQQKTVEYPVEPPAVQEEQIDISLPEVRLWWPAFISAVKNQNSPLANVIRSSELYAVDGATITIKVKFSFHRQNVENQKNQQLLRAALEQIAGKKLAIKALVVTGEASSDAEPQANLADALQVFGGEVIE